MATVNPYPMVVGWMSSISTRRREKEDEERTRREGRRRVNQIRTQRHQVCKSKI
jgi:hypothetical protein